MNLEGDIQWIKAEMDHIKDPLLIETFKNLLNYSRKHEVSDPVQLEMEQMIREGLDDIENGRVISTEDLLKEVSTWK